MMIDRKKLNPNKLRPTAPAKLHPTFYERVRNSVIQEGFKQPLVVLQTTVREWRMLVHLSPGLLSPNEEEDDNENVLLVMCGNNRLMIAKELDVDVVKCFVCDTTDEVSRLCSLQRKSWALETSKLLKPTESQKTQ